MPIWKNMKGIPSEKLPAAGLMYHDWNALTPCQRECNIRLGMTIQLEQEAYLTQHPEVKAMLELFICKATRSAKRNDILKEAAEHFTRPAMELDKEIREKLGVPYSGPYTKEAQPPYNFVDVYLDSDLKDITVKHFPPKPWSIPTSSFSTVNTPSSSFLSIVTSDTTLPTPEPILTPEPTLSEVFFEVVSNTVDKAIFTHVDDKALRYDTAYVELTKCMEQAMEIPILDIKEDIAELYYNAFILFEQDIIEKERIAAEIAWEKRMRKKLKRTLRRQNNFKAHSKASFWGEQKKNNKRKTDINENLEFIGYETPPTTPKSEISSHESYKKPPLRPCVCHPQFNYNRYAKDRFGIYQPREDDFSPINVTATPAISTESLVEEPDDGKVDTKSVVSGKSTASKKTATKT